MTPTWLNLIPDRWKSLTIRHLKGHVFTISKKVTNRIARDGISIKFDPPKKSMVFSGTPKDMGPLYGKRDPYYSHTTPIFESLEIWAPND